MPAREYGPALFYAASIQEEKQHMVNEIADWLSKLLTQGRDRGIFDFKGNPYGKALTIATSLAGALQLARVVGDEHFFTIVQQIKLELTP